MKTITVILCAYNPQPKTFRLCLEALARQSLPSQQWELLIVDNNSAEPVSNLVPPEYLPRHRTVIESKQGLTQARIKGIHEAKGDLLVFVDDDNVLDPDYLLQALQIGIEHPFLGCWGGTCRGAFEVEPPTWSKPYLEYLAVREVTRPMWSNYLEFKSMPFGAGLCCLASVARRFRKTVRQDSRRAKLGRSGTQLMAGEDTDLAMHSYDLGLGTGVFPQLRLDHHIDGPRLEPEYMSRLIEGISCSTALLEYFYTGKIPQTSQSRIDRIASTLKGLRLPPTIRRIELAKRQGRIKATAILQNTFYEDQT